MMLHLDSAYQNQQHIYGQCRKSWYCYADV